MEQPLTVTVAEAARRLGISRQHAHDLIRRNAFPVRVIRVGARWRVPVALLNQFVEGQS